MHFLVFSIILLESFVGKIVRLDDKKYNIFIKEYDPSIVIIYEEWCGFSKKALKIFNSFKKDPVFTKLDIIVGLFDVHSFPDFKAYNNIKKFPLIELHIHKVKITYTGPLS